MLWCCLLCTLHYRSRPAWRARFMDGARVRTTRESNVVLFTSGWADKAILACVTSACVLCSDPSFRGDSEGGKRNNELIQGKGSETVKANLGHDIPTFKNGTDGFDEAKSIISGPAFRVDDYLSNLFLYSRCQCGILHRPLTRRQGLLYFPAFWSPISCRYA